MISGLFIHCYLSFCFLICLLPLKPSNYSKFQYHHRLCVSLSGERVLEEYTTVCFFMKKKTRKVKQNTRICVVCFFKSLVNFCQNYFLLHYSSYYFTFSVFFDMFYGDQAQRGCAVCLLSPLWLLFPPLLVGVMQKVHHDTTSHLEI